MTRLLAATVGLAAIVVGLWPSSSKDLRTLGSGPVVLVLDVGGLYAFYLTPLSGYTHEHPWVGVAVHVHMVLAGFLLAWYVVGVDPPSRPIAARITVLLLAAAAHDVLAKLIYARHLPSHMGDVEAGARWLYLGGTAVEVGLAVALMAGWYARGGRRLRHEHRRAGLTASGP